MPPLSLRVVRVLNFDPLRRRIARNQLALADRYVGDATEAVMFQFEDPIWVIEWLT